MHLQHHKTILFHIEMFESFLIIMYIPTLLSIVLFADLQHRSIFLA